MEVTNEVAKNDNDGEERRGRAGTPTSSSDSVSGNVNAHLSGRKEKNALQRKLN